MPVAIKLSNQGPRSSSNVVMAVPMVMASSTATFMKTTIAETSGDRECHESKQFDHIKMTVPPVVPVPVQPGSAKLAQALNEVLDGATGVPDVVLNKKTIKATLEEVKNEMEAAAAAPASAPVAEPATAPVGGVRVLPTEV